MKGMARSLVYWPGIDADIERIAKSCTECAKHAHAPFKCRNHHWEYPKGPWERIHIDYAGPVAGMMLLIIVDAFSKWVEVKVTRSATSYATITILDELFATYGAPVTVVSDNGRQFVSAEFKTFLQSSGVRYHKLSAPYHPSTNGQVERYVQTVKDSLQKMETTQSTLQRDVNEFLRQYRKAPHTMTGLPPAQLFLGRNIRTRLDLVRPEEKQTQTTKEQQKKGETLTRSFQPLQKVYFLSGNARMDKWIPGTIVTRLGCLHYEIDYQGRAFKRQVDQIRAFGTDDSQRTIRQSLSPSRAMPESARRIRFYDASLKIPDTRQGQVDSPQSPSSPTGCIPAQQQDNESARRSSIFSPPVSEPMGATPQKPAVPKTTQNYTEECAPALQRSAREKKPVQRFSPT